MLVHNGKTYTPVNITPEMVGHKVCTSGQRVSVSDPADKIISQLGEFAPTRKPFSYR